jgi:hypothetical protein
MVQKISRAAYAKLSATLFGGFVKDGSLVTKKDPCRLMNINLAACYLHPLRHKLKLQFFTKSLKNSDDAFFNEQVDFIEETVEKLHDSAKDYIKNFAENHIDSENLQNDPQDEEAFDSDEEGDLRSPAHSQGLSNACQNLILNEGVESEMKK